MTVIAWDGKTLAADKQLSINGTVARTTKLFRIKTGEVLACCGGSSAGRQMVHWYKSGADVGAWPDIQKTDDWARLIVFGSHGLKYYEQTPIAINVEDPFFAFGSGMDVALGAMAMGATAQRAVEIASQFTDSCGLGVDSFEME